MKELLDTARAFPVPESAEVTCREMGLQGSFALGLRDLARLAAAVGESLRDGADAVVVTHGTDSMEETAFALALVHADDRPIVLTGRGRLHRQRPTPRRHLPDDRPPGAPGGCSAVWWRVAPALLANVFYSTGFVLEKRALSSLPPLSSGQPAQVVRLLIGSPLWLGGSLALAAGFAAQLAVYRTLPIAAAQGIL